MIQERNSATQRGSWSGEADVASGLHVFDLKPGPFGLEVTSGSDDVGDNTIDLQVTPSMAGLPSWNSTPEGGPLTLATTGQFILPSLDRACLSARVAADNKARDIVVLDMRAITPLYDYFVLATGTSRRQIHTISEEVDAALHDVGDRRLAIEGYEASTWIVQDYGDVMVHVFNPQTREYYALEELWADAPRVDWENFELPDLSDSGEE
jgi:ribosome-associated protein